MNWQIYTKLVQLDEGTVGLRWYWRDPDGRESPNSFISRQACEADAAQFGYISTGQDEGAIAAYWQVDAATE